MANELYAFAVYLRCCYRQIKLVSWRKKVTITFAWLNSLVYHWLHRKLSNDNFWGSQWPQMPSKWHNGFAMSVFGCPETKHFCRHHSPEWTFRWKYENVRWLFCVPLCLGQFILVPTIPTSCVTRDLADSDSFKCWEYLCARQIVSESTNNADSRFARSQWETALQTDSRFACSQ